MNESNGSQPRFFEFIFFRTFISNVRLKRSNSRPKMPNLRLKRLTTRPKSI